MDKDLGALLAGISDFVYVFDDASLPALGNPDVVEIRDQKATVTSVAGILRYPDKTVLAFQEPLPNDRAKRSWIGCKISASGK